MKLKSIVLAVVFTAMFPAHAEDTDITRGDVAALGSSSTVMTINQSGVYPLTTNYSGQILISANNVTLDMQGFTISGGTYGVRITGNNCTVKDGIITGAVVGLQIESNNNEIYGLDLISNGTGLRIFNGNNNVVYECHALQNSAAGFRSMGGQNNRFVNCTAIGNGGTINAYGFVAQDGSGNTFENCLAENTATTGASPLYAAGFALTGTEQKSAIVDCMALNASGALNYGMLISGTVSVPQNNVLRDNQASGNSIGYRDDYAASFASGTNEWIGNLSANNTTNFNIGSQYPISAATGTGVGETENIDGLLTSTIGGPAERIMRTIVDQVTTSSILITQLLQYNPTFVTGVTTLSTAGYYILTTYVPGQINVSGTNITFNLNGHTVGNIMVNSSTNVSILNGFVRTTAYPLGTATSPVTDGLVIDTSNDVNVSNVFVTGSREALRAQNTANARIKITSCLVNSNLNTGIWFQIGTDGVVDLCQANKQTQFQGFAVDTGNSRFVFSRCQGNRNGRNGFALASARVRSCSAVGNSVFAVGSGFTAVDVTVSNFVNNFAQGNTANGGVNYVAGIRWGTVAASTGSASYTANISA